MLRSYLRLIVVALTASCSLANPIDPEILQKNLDVDSESFRSLGEVEAFLLPPSCPPPYQSSGGLCLLFNNQSLTWQKAEEFCSKRGGHLVWIKSHIEHNIVRGFAQMVGSHAGYFWTGLHRNSKDMLVWSSGTVSDYRGSPFTDQKLPFVSADSRDHQFDGDDQGMNLSSVCRRQLHRNRRRINLAMLLEHNRMEIEDQVRAYGIVTMKKIQETVDKLAEAINEKIVKCPSPWIKTKNMCLMYIFQLRSWPEAEDLCTGHGGTLVWWDNADEKQFIRTLSWSGFKRYYRFFWVGLHKDASGKIIWTGHNSYENKDPNADGDTNTIPYTNTNNTNNTPVSYTHLTLPTILLV